MRRRRTQRRPRQKHQKRAWKIGFLNRYDFVYVGRDTVNQIGKIATGLIKNASSEINNIAQQRINQIISQGEKETERYYWIFLGELPKMFTKCLFVC